MPPTASRRLHALRAEVGEPGEDGGALYMLYRGGTRQCGIFVLCRTIQRGLRRLTVAPGELDLIVGPNARNSMHNQCHRPLPSQACLRSVCSRCDQLAPDPPWIHGPARSE